MNQLYPYKLYYNIVKHALKRLILRRGVINREQSYVATDYSEAWDVYTDAFIMGKRIRPQKLYGKVIICRSIDHRKFFIQHISEHIRSVKPKKVLELGSGVGINLFALAVMNPDIKHFTGIELTKRGVQAAQEYLKKPPLQSLTYITGENEETILTRLKAATFEFIVGDMTKMPWKEPSFDFTYSLWVFEQMPRVYLQAFKEAYRVTKGHTLFLEAFREANENIFQRIHLRNVDYFNGSIKEVENIGFKTLKFEQMPMTKIKFTNGSLFSSANL